MSIFDRDGSHLFQRTLVAPSLQLLPGGSGRDFPTVANQALGVTLSVDSSGRLVLPATQYGNNVALKFGDGDDITVAWDGSYLVVSQAAADSEVHWGASGAGINHTFYGDTAGRDLQWDQTNDQLIALDSAKIGVGSGAGGAADITLSWDGTRCNVNALTADSEIRWGVDGAGIDQRWYGDTASAYMLWDQSSDARILGGAAVDVYTQSATGTGQLVRIDGPDTTHGLARYSYTATVSPSAIETALFTVPANSRIVSTSMNIESALTGGGTTVTASIGITGDVDAYGTMGAPTDLLTKNSKGIWMGVCASGAGASLGVFSKSTVALKLIAAATGGASAGNTALTVGSVKITVIYETLLGIADAA